MSGLYRVVLNTPRVQSLEPGYQMKKSRLVWHVKSNLRLSGDGWVVSTALFHYDVTSDIKVGQNDILLIYHLSARKNLERNSQSLVTVIQTMIIISLQVKTQNSSMKIVNTVTQHGRTYNLKLSTCFFFSFISPS